MKTYKKISLPTVTIAVCALNEENNIGRFLDSVLKQAEIGFKIKDIWVISDGSKDKTVEIAKSFKNNKIKVFDFKTRIGKSSRLNFIYRKLKKDFLVQSDADVVFAHKYVVRDMIKPMLFDKDVWMCGGNPLPLKAQTFTEKAVNITCEAYQKFRSQVRGGNNIFSADGRLLVYRKKLVKKIVVPATMIANDAFTYYCCLSLGYKYVFVPSAKIYFRSPQNIRDQIKQNTRFVATPFRMTKYFDKDLVKRETQIPRSIYFKNVLPQLVRYPVESIYIVSINRYCHFKARIKESTMTGKWAMAISTKIH